MIASLSGKTAQVEKDHLIVSVGGVGLLVYAPADLCARAIPGESVFLHTHLVVREDSLTLFGFETEEYRQLFLLLLGVNGVGPRLALAVLSQLSPDALRRAVFNENIDLFARVPGVGRKTAQKILLHLQDRLKPGITDLAPISALTDVDSQVLDALTSLGYSVIEAQAALQFIPRDTPPDLEARLRIALSYFSS